MGNFQNYFKHGFGTYYYNNGNIFEGNWRDDKRDGFGKLYFNNGTIFEGNWYMDHRNGNGILFYKDGSMFEGEFVNSLRHGIGKRSWPDGTSWRGVFQKRIPLDKGEYEFTDGSKLIEVFFLCLMEELELNFWIIIREANLNLAEIFLKHHISGKNLLFMKQSDLINLKLEYYDMQTAIQLLYQAKQEVIPYTLYPFYAMLDKYVYDLRKLTLHPYNSSYIYITISGLTQKYYSQLLHLRCPSALFLF